MNFGGRESRGCAVGCPSRKRPPSDTTPFRGSNRGKARRRKPRLARLDIRNVDRVRVVGNGKPTPTAVALLGLFGRITNDAVADAYAKFQIEPRKFSGELTRMARKPHARIRSAQSLRHSKPNENLSQNGAGYEEIPQKRGRDVNRCVPS
jgi:hypothetical protein